MKKTYFELEGEIEFRKVFLSRIEELRRSSLSDAVTETKKEGGEMARILRLADFESEISAKIKKEGRRQRSRSRSGSRGRSSSATVRSRRWDVAPPPTAGATTDAVLAATAGGMQGAAAHVVGTHGQVLGHTTG